MEYLHDKRASVLILRVARPLLLAIVPAGVLTNILFPPLALFDGAPTILITCYVLWRVHKYRFVQTPQKS
ncbi:hypothetical protein KC976_00095 [Candidatus Saccharibacteria bacterium]|nr:hypothetical protein [Candidatus Saccharibacteria bacterium]